MGGMTAIPVVDPILTSDEVEAYTNGSLKAATLKWWRATDREGQPAPVRAGRRVGYRRSVIDAYLDGGTLMLPSKFWSKTATDTGCVLWIGAVNSKGYGCFAVAGVSKLAHRVVWEDTHGPIPDELQLDHLCRVRNCVNVDHLELGEREREPAEEAGPDRGRRRVPERASGSTGDLYISPKRRTAECRACRRELSRSRRRAVA